MNEVRDAIIQSLYLRSYILPSKAYLLHRSVMLLVVKAPVVVVVLFYIILLGYGVEGFRITSSLIPYAKRKLNMANGHIPYVPYFPSKPSKDYMWMDIYNALGRNRTLFVSRYLDEESCNQLIASLIWLQSENQDPITMYFNVPGAISKPALAVFDTLQRMRCPLVTVNTGLTVGMGALLCAAGTPGMRSAFPNARFLMSKTGMDDGAHGQAIDIHQQVQEVSDKSETVRSYMSCNIVSIVKQLL